MSGVQLHSLREVWAHAVERFPNKTAAVAEGAAHTFVECDRLTDRLSASLRERFGLRKGATVAVAAPNGFEYFLLFWAVMKSGAVIVPVNTRLSLPETEHLLCSAEAEIVLVHAVHRDSIRKALAAAARKPRIIAVGFEEDDATPFASLLAHDVPSAAPDAPGEDDLAIVMHTSGTTGRPKGAMMRHGDLLFNNRLAVYAHSLRHEDIHLVILPMYHATPTYSLLPTSALLASTVVLAPRAEIPLALDLIQAHRCTTFFGVPALFRFLATVPGLERRDLRSLRLLAYAGSPMPPDVIRRLRALFPRAALHNFFGLTETISMTHVLPDADADARPESIGKLLPHVRQRILGADGRDVAPGAVGELHFHRDNVIPGYWKEPQRLAESLRGEWFNTGDLARVDADGYVYLEGRSKDMIIVGGENVYAGEVERCLAAHPQVLEAAVVGVPAAGLRAHLGELVKAVLVARPGATPDPADVKRHCLERLATYKVPQVIEWRAELPRNSAGKVLKDLLR